MYPWLVCITVFVAVVILFFYRKSLHEGFKGNVFVDQMKFNEKQETYFHDQIEKGIITNDGLELGELNAALKNPDLDLPNSPDKDFRPYLMKDPQSGYTDADKKFCRYARQPRDLPPAVKGSSVACGWWFHPNRRSIGVLGTRKAAVIADGLTPGGTWIWDRAEAQEKEDFKMCKRIRSCDVAVSDRFHGVCGFCARLGYAVPIRSDGSEKYPNSALEETCGENVYTTSAQCNPPKLPDILAEDGTPCGTTGKPSADMSRRIYTKPECDDLNGILSPEGLCVRDDGGSYSVDCRGLNTPVGASSGGESPDSICKPDANGKLTRECLSGLALGVGYSKSGGIVRMILTARAPSENEVLALKLCGNAGVNIDSQLLGGGAIDKDSAIIAYESLYNLITGGSTKMIRSSAELLCTGTEEFDICDYEDNDKGPYQLECLQKAWRQAGCQPAGTGAPNDSTASSFASMTWKAVIGTFTAAYNAMAGKDAKSQDEAMKKCIGVQYDRKEENCYIETPGGYDQGTGQPFCFFATRQEVENYCDTSKDCRGYSFEKGVAGAGSGCIKTGPFTSFQRDPNYTGFTKKTYYQKRADLPSWTDVLDAGQWQVWGGQLNTISVGADGQVWGTNRNNNIYWSTSPAGTWRDEYGTLVQVSTRGNASRMTVGTGTDGSIWHYRTHNVVNVSSGWDRIAENSQWASVGSDGTVWTIGKDHSIWQYNGSGFNNYTRIPGALVMCSVVNRNDVWGVNGNDDAFHWNGSEWTWIPGKIVDIAASEDGSKVVAVTRGGAVFYRRGNEWVHFPGLVSRMAISNNAVVCTQGQVHAPYGIYIMNFS